MLIGNTTMETDALRANHEKFFREVERIVAGIVYKLDVSPEIENKTRQYLTRLAMEVAKTELEKKGADLFGPATKWWKKFWYGRYNVTRIDVIIDEDGKTFVQVKATCFR